MEVNTSMIERTAKEIVQECLKGKDINKLYNDTYKSNTQNNQAKLGFDSKLASAIEHSMIRPDATPAMVKQFCEEAVFYNFRNVALAPCFVELAAQLLKGTRVRVSTAVAFPMGIATTRIKVTETIEVIEKGATEIDLPINIGLIKACEFNSIKEEIEAIVAAAKGKALIKVVVDLGALTEVERIKVGLLGKIAGADFLKVAAGSKPGGVTVEDMKIMRQTVGLEMGIKADGGIKDFKAAIAIIEAGATTIGASGSIKIVTKA